MQNLVKVILLRWKRKTIYFKQQDLKVQVLEYSLM